MRKILGVTAAALIALSVPSAAQQQNKWVTIVNNTNNTLLEFRASHNSTGGWGRDLLNNDSISSGSSYRINLDDGSRNCMYDLKAVFDRGNDVTHFRFNVCAETEWRLVSR